MAKYQVGDCFKRLWEEHPEKAIVSEIMFVAPSLDSQNKQKYFCKETIGNRVDFEEEWEHRLDSMIKL